MTFINDGRLQQKNMAADPATVSGYAHLYSKAKAGVSNLYWEADDGTVYDLSQLAVNADALVTKSGSPFTVASNASLTVSWSAAEIDTASFWAGGSPTRLTVAATGDYAVSAQVGVVGGYGDSVTTAGLYLRIIIGGFTRAETITILPNSNSLDLTAFLARPLHFTAGDYLELQIHNNSDVTQTFATTTARTWLAISRLA